MQILPLFAAAVQIRSQKSMRDGPRKFGSGPGFRASAPKYPTSQPSWYPGYSSIEGKESGKGWYRLCRVFEGSWQRPEAKPVTDAARPVLKFVEHLKGGMLGHYNCGLERFAKSRAGARPSGAADRLDNGKRSGKGHRVGSPVPHTFAAKCGWNQIAQQHRFMPTAGGSICAPLAGGAASLFVTSDRHFWNAI